MEPYGQRVDMFYMTILTRRNPQISIDIAGYLASISRRVVSRTARYEATIEETVLRDTVIYD